jgi:glycosyltransferase involved in cell wall biosynthesis
MSGLPVVVTAVGGLVEAVQEYAGVVLVPPRPRRMGTRLRILQVTDLFEPFIGGLEQHVKTLASGLAQRGHEVTVVTAHLPGTTADEAVGRFRVRRVTGWSGRALAPWYERREAPFHPPMPDPGIAAALRQLIAELRPHIVHAHGWISYTCLAMAKDPPFQLVVTLHDYGLACVRKTLMRDGREACPGPRIGGCLRCAAGQFGAVKGLALTLGLRAARPLHNRAASWVAISRFVAESSRCVLPPGCHVSVIPPASAEPPAGRRPGWLPADGYALFVGALGAHKGLSWLLDAYGGGGFARPLVVIGTPRPDTPRTWPAGVVVRTEVPHEEVMEAWRRAGVGLVPSLWPEPFGLVAVEAMRSGVPVVASRIGGLPEVVVDGSNGILVTPGNTAELRAAIRRLDGDASLRQTMGASGRLLAEQFSAEAVTARHEQHYLRLLARQREPGAPSVASAGRSLP